MGEGKAGTHPGASVPWSRGLGYDPAGLTRSLYSARLRMTAVICWSMKMRIDSSRAGRAAATLSHQGLVPKGDTSQSRPGSVGWGRTFHRQIGAGLPRVPRLHTPALAFFHNLPYCNPSPSRPWKLGRSGVCVCTAFKASQCLERGQEGDQTRDWAGARGSGFCISGALLPCKRRRW